MKYYGKVVKSIETVSNKFLNSALDREFAKPCNKFLSLLKNIDGFHSDIKSKGESNMFKVLMFKKDEGCTETGGFVRVCSM